MRRLMAAVAVLALMALTTTASAFTLAEWERYGNVVPTCDAKSLAMGGNLMKNADTTSLRNFLTENFVKPQESKK